MDVCGQPLGFEDSDRAEALYPTDRNTRRCRLSRLWRFADCRRTTARAPFRCSRNQRPLPLPRDIAECIARSRSVRLLEQQPIEPAQILTPQAAFKQPGDQVGNITCDLLIHGDTGEAFFIVELFVKNFAIQIFNQGGNQAFVTIRTGSEAVVISSTAAPFPEESCLAEILVQRADLRAFNCLARPARFLKSSSVNRPVCAGWRRGR